MHGGYSPAAASISRASPPSCCTSPATLASVSALSHSTLLVSCSLALDLSGVAGCAARRACARRFLTRVRLVWAWRGCGWLVCVRLGFGCMKLVGGEVLGMG